MRLSEAMALGRVTCELKPGNWNSCALGCAANAVGIPQWGNVGNGRFLPIVAYWPWLRWRCPCGCGSGAATHIFETFDNEVYGGRITMEELIDWVRSVEPMPLGLPAPAEPVADLWGAELTSTIVNHPEFGRVVTAERV